MGLALNGIDMRRGKASSVLQGAWGKPGTIDLYSAVEVSGLLLEKVSTKQLRSTSGIEPSSVMGKVSSPF